MFKTILAAALALLAPALASADDTTKRMSLTIPATGSYNWAQKADNNFYAIDTNTFVLNGANTMVAGSSATVNPGVPWLYKGSSISFTQSGSGIYMEPATAVTSTFTAQGIQENYGVKAATANLTGTGNTTYSLQTSSGINVSAGGVTAPWHAGPLHGVADSAITVPTSGVDLSTVTSALALKANDNAVVHLATSENVTGTKVFTNSGNTTPSVVTSSNVQVGGGLVAAFVSVSTGGVTAASGTFTASGNTNYSISTSSGISLAAGCIHLPTGDICSPASGGGGGDMSSTGNNFVTGNTTFYNFIGVSSVAFAPGMTIEVSSAAMNAESSHVFSISGTTDTFILHYSLKWNTADGFLQWTFNGDTGNNYDRVAFRLASGGSTQQSNTGAGTPGAYCITQYVGENVTAGTTVTGTFEFSGTPGGRIIQGHGNSDYVTSTNFFAAGWFGCRYSGSANLSSITMTTSNGTVSGWVYIERHYKR